MKALSLTQPWASLVAKGTKQYETRSWSTNHRGVVAIHAAKGFPKDARELCGLSPFVRGLQGMTLGSLPLGAIVAVVQIVNVAPTERYDNDEAFRETDEFAFGNYERGRFAWRLTGAVALPTPLPCKGMLGLWEVPLELAERIRLEVTL